VWPTRDDIQDVLPEFVIEKGVVPECLSSGRLWNFTNCNKYQELYNSYSRLFFETANA